MIESLHLSTRSTNLTSMYGFFASVGSLGKTNVTANSWFCFLFSSFAFTKSRNASRLLLCCFESKYKDLRLSEPSIAVIT